MKSPVVGLRIASFLFGVGALSHIIRLVTHFDVVIAGYPLPLWASIGGALIAGSLSVWMWLLSCKTTR